MKRDDKIDILVDLVQEVRSDVRDMKDTQIKQSIDIERNTESLEEHIRRTNLLEEGLKSHIQVDNVRFDKLEAPARAKKLIVDWLLKMGTGVGIFYSFLQIMDWFKK